MGDPGTQTKGEQMKEPGELKTFGTGANREDKTGKGRPDLISPIMLHRLAILMEEGGLVHGDRSWEKGMPVMSYLACAFRHLIQVLNGEEDEDHPIQCIFNLQAYIHTLEKIKDRSLPGELDDRPWKKATERDWTPEEKRADGGIGRGWKVRKSFVVDDGSSPYEEQQATCCGLRYQRHVYVVDNDFQLCGHTVDCGECGRRLDYA